MRIHVCDMTHSHAAYCVQISGAAAPTDTDVSSRKWLASDLLKVEYSVLQCVAVCCSVLQCVCSVLQCVAVSFATPG